MAKHPTDLTPYLKGSGILKKVLFFPAVIVILALATSPAWSRDNTITAIQAPFAVTTAQQQMGILLEWTPDTDMLGIQRGNLMNFPISDHETIDLELERFEISTRDMLIVQGTDAGDIPVDHSDMVLFRGRVVDMADSHVVLGVSPRGITGVISMAAETIIFSPQRKNRSAGETRQHVLYRASELHGASKTEKLPLSTEDVDQAFADSDAFGIPEDSGEPELPGTFQITRLALECDYEYWSQFNDMNLALDYIYVLFAKIGDMFERDVNVKLALTYIRIWTTINDPYSYVGGDVTGLHEFQNYWNLNHNPGQSEPVERDLAHLLSSRSVGAWANTGVLCSYAYGFSISGGNALLPTLAENLFHDIRYAGHEIGHNFDAKHTHCFNPPIDQCDVESGCNQVKDCSTAPSTLMSYCHQCPGGGNNIQEKFHPLNVTRMRSHIVNSCLRVARNPCYVDWRNTSGFEDGTATFPYNAMKEGVEGVLPYGTVSVANGNYDEPLTIWQPMTVTAAGGAVIIGK